MTDLIIDCKESCNNSPKKQLLKELLISLAKNDIAFFLEFVTDDITWNIIGKNQIQGKEAIKDKFSKVKNEQIEFLQIHNIITHGNVGSINGTLVSKQQRIHFCHVYNFQGHNKNSKIKQITSYIIKE